MLYVIGQPISGFPRNVVKLVQYQDLMIKKKKKKWRKAENLAFTLKRQILLRDLQ